MYYIETLKRVLIPVTIPYTFIVPVILKLKKGEGGELMC
jgi:hypothetical protein